MITPKVIKADEGLSLLGGRQTIKLFATDSDGSVSYMLSKVPAGSGIPTHTHQWEDETFLMLSGTLEVAIGGNPITLNEGDMIFMPRHIPHGFTALTDVQMWVTFTPGGAEKMFEALAALPPGPPSKELCALYGITF